MAKSNHFFKSRIGSLLLGALLLVATFLVFLRASDTGSLQQYGILFVLLYLGLNRLLGAALPKKQV